MAKELKLRRGTTVQHSTFTGAAGEVTVDTDKNTAIVHDGTTAGGHQLAKTTDIGDATYVAGADGSSGQVLQSDGDGTMSWTTLAAGGGFSNMDVFTSPGTWTNPGSVEKVKVTVVGGGGGGSSSAGGTIAGYGGSGGGTAIEVIPFPSGTNVPVTVGGGGSGAPGPSSGSGSSGGTSSFGAYCSATGGSGGGPGGTGGNGSGGQLNMRGQAGDAFMPSPLPIKNGGTGGSSSLGGGGRGGRPSPTSASPGGLYGGGGGGASGSYVAGGPGGAGVVIVEY